MELLLIIILLVVLVLLWVCLSRSKIYGGVDVVKNLMQFPRTKSEAAVIKILENITNAEFPTVNPDWLVYKGRTLELDGYNKDLKLAIEFSGPLHRKWFPGVETYESYLERVRKDLTKIQKCKEHGVDLIIIDSELPSRHWSDYLKSRLRDVGKLEYVGNYITEQEFKPWLRDERDIIAP